VIASSASGSVVEHGWRLLSAGRAREALACAEGIVARNAAAISALHLQCEAALKCGRAAIAERAAETIIRQNPSLHWAWILLARARLACGFPGEATGAARNAIALFGATAATFGNAGAVFSAAGQHEAALECFTRAAEIDPADTRHLFNLAMQRRYLGDLVGAEADCDRLIALDPDHFEAWLIRSGLRQQTADENHVPGLRARLARGVGSWRGEGQLRYALSKELEDLGEDKQAFAELSRGAQLRRAHLDYDVRRDLDMIDALIAGFANDETQSGVSEGGAGAIFIVGLPRTGTTLAERILSSHTQVDSLGEPSAFPAAMMAGMQKVQRPVRNAQERVSAALAIPPEELGQGYFDRLQGLRGNGSHFIDKLPMNFLNLGLIRRSLPGAKVIHLRRNPMDAGYAMFKTWFADAYPFSYDQQELGEYIAAYHRLMAHWKALYPGEILEIDYEELVSDVEGHARAMLAHCGLGWEEACAMPHRNELPSTTASASQIRLPTHSRSIGAWTRYRDELQPLFSTLQSAGLA
jgi:tetratricopeptide (TPR) repeat protein